ncbi:allantoinase [Lentinula raphanica]|uniref:allantoinase n=1 Tax=Lentinula raphanica TaxID=153919 RepID=A0AA38PA80_9AGAR|nr:allantoinase [Lentinula raphanica]KAJ3838990.1 allantoinase [Lentinula raphanica]
MTFIICRGSQVLLPSSSSLQPATIIIEADSGKIVEVHPRILSEDSLPPHVHLIDGGPNVILPGLVDAHVHLNEPGRTDWEGFCTGTKAAASGGVTTVVDMPLNSIPPTVTVENLSVKRAAAQGQCFTDVAFWGGVIPGNQADLKPLVDAGVKGFKCFLIESGVDEFPCVDEKDLNESMEVLQDQPTTLLFHAELDNHTAPVDDPSDPKSYSTFLSSRPDTFEVDAISLITQLQHKHPNLPCHIVHLSSSKALPLIRDARKAGLKLSVETCFHYLCLSAEDIPHGKTTAKCCPPIREASNRELLWDALKDGTIDIVVSDHSPCVQALKKIDEGDIMGAWGGISTLGLGLSLLWTEGSRRGISLAQIIDWTSVKTAKHAGLEERKGKLQTGYDADFIIWNPDAKFTVAEESLQFKNKISPYVGLELRGRVEKTFLRGSLVYDGSRGVEGIEPEGMLL